MQEATFATTWEGEAERSLEEGCIEIECPHCQTVRRMEPDSYDVVTCEGCGKQYRKGGRNERDKV